MGGLYSDNNGDDEYVDELFNAGTAAMQPHRQDTGISALESEPFRCIFGPSKGA